MEEVEQAYMAESDRRVLERFRRAERRFFVTEIELDKVRKSILKQSKTLKWASKSHFYVCFVILCVVRYFSVLPLHPRILKNLGSRFRFLKFGMSGKKDEPKLKALSKPLKRI